MGTFEIKAVKDGGLMFNLKATNGQVIGTSEVYNKRASLDTGIASVQANAPVAPVEDQTAETVVAQKCPKFEVYADKAGKPRFRLKAKNGEIILASQGYSDIKTCLAGIESVKKNAVDAKIVVVEA